VAFGIRQQAFQQRPEINLNSPTLRTKTIIICDNPTEEQVARAYLLGLGAQVGPSETVDDLSIYETDGVPPNATFTGTYSRLGTGLKLVTGTWP
jgi:hypothetical protein